MRCRLMAAQDLVHVCHAKGFVRSETPVHVGQSFSDFFSHAARNDGLAVRVVLGFNEVERSAVPEFPIVQDRCFFKICSTRSVHPPLARDDIHMAVSIQLTKGYYIPPTGQVVKRGAWGVEHSKVSLQD